MNRSKKPPRPAPIVERSRDHHRFVNQILEALDAGHAVSHEETLALADEVKDLRAILSSITRGVPVDPAASQNHSG